MVDEKSLSGQPDLEARVTHLHRHVISDATAASIEPELRQLGLAIGAELPVLLDAARFGDQDQVRSATERLAGRKPAGGRPWRPRRRWPSGRRGTGGDGPPARGSGRHLGRVVAEPVGTVQGLWRLITDPAARARADKAAKHAAPERDAEVRAWIAAQVAAGVAHGLARRQAVQHFYTRYQLSRRQIARIDGGPFVLTLLDPPARRARPEVKREAGDRTAHP